MQGRGEATGPRPHYELCADQLVETEALTSWASPPCGVEPRAALHPVHRRRANVKVDRMALTASPASCAPPEPSSDPAAGPASSPQAIPVAEHTACRWSLSSLDPASKNSYALRFLAPGDTDDKSALDPGIRCAPGGGYVLV